ncbi:DUF6538 domain-containing protein [Methylomonas fluvii]|uniref:DUF6538 domain-containing protein n=1 Tax=Methylomonas fluvii TaxID=1854564 RepID=UPI00352CFABD
MTRIRYLFRRRSIYYFRFVVPLEYKHSLSFSHVTISLKTEIRDQAESKALQFSANIKSFLLSLKSDQQFSLTREELIKTWLTSGCSTVVATPSSITAPISQSRASKLSVVVDNFLNR